MKRCPTCDKTYDDAMRFCQTDGTPLVEDQPVDPYKTMVARPEDIAAAIPRETKEPEPEKPEPQPASEPKQEEPAEQDLKKTMYASEDEIRRAMAEVDKVDDKVAEDSAPSEPEPPQFIEPSLGGPPLSPFSDRPAGGDDSPPKTTPPIPSPFSEPKREPEPAFEPPAPEPPSFVKQEQKASDSNPFNDPAPAFGGPMERSDKTPAPAAQDKSRPNEPMQNPQYQPGSGLPSSGQSKVLPIVSLVFGILSLCCYFAPLTGLVALITGFLGMKNANNDPANYGGKGLAVAGMILGGLFFVLGLAYYVFLLFFGGMGMMMEMINRAG